MSSKETTLVSDSTISSLGWDASKRSPLMQSGRSSLVRGDPTSERGIGEFLAGSVSRLGIGEAVRSARGTGEDMSVLGIGDGMSGRGETRVRDERMGVLVREGAGDTREGAGDTRESLETSELPELYRYLARL